MTDKRDPRVDPKPGDMLMSSRMRTVSLVTINEYYIHVLYRTKTGMRGRCLIAQWRKWAADAEVIHAAE